MGKLRIAVLFGGRSTEHEVSIITGLQVIHNLDKNKYSFLPIYITKNGQWIIGDETFAVAETYKNLDLLPKIASHGLLDITSNQPRLISKNDIGPLMYGKSGPKIDLFFPVFHGTFGEDGTIQGLLELANLPYVGSGVLASALGMDKVAQKMVFQAAGLPQVKYVHLYREGPKDIKGLKFPVFVKPANGGSSIGVTKVKSHKELDDALEVAFYYDQKVIIEESAEGCREINISILGNAGSDLKTSVCEQPVPSKDLLSYQDKYQSSGSKSRGMAGAKRFIPAPIKPATANKIAELAKTAYQALDCCGLARVDFLVSRDEGRIYINEINTIPGSLAFYLWEKSGLPFPHLLDQLVQLAFERHQNRARTTYTFNSNILATIGETLKGGKFKG